MSEGMLCYIKYESFCDFFGFDVHYKVFLKPSVTNH